MDKYHSFNEFWPFYVGEHRHALTRILHFTGTLIMVILVILSIRYNAWLIFAAPVAGYGFAWFSHFFIEKNRPATFTYPAWSLIADLKMFMLMCVGKMQREIDQLPDDR